MLVKKCSSETLSVGEMKNGSIHVLDPSYRPSIFNLVENETLFMSSWSDKCADISPALSPQCPSQMCFFSYSVCLSRPSESLFYFIH